MITTPLIICKTRADAALEASAHWRKFGNTCDPYNHEFRTREAWMDFWIEQYLDGVSVNPSGIREPHELIHNQLMIGTIGELARHLSYRNRWALLTSHCRRGVLQDSADLARHLSSNFPNCVASHNQFLDLVRKNIPAENFKRKN